MTSNAEAPGVFNWLPSRRRTGRRRGMGGRFGRRDDFGAVGEPAFFTDVARQMLLCAARRGTHQGPHQRPHRQGCEHPAGGGEVLSSHGWRLGVSFAKINDVHDPTLHHAGLLLLRTLPSAIMMTHGWPKFLRLVEQLGTESGVKFFDFMGLGPEVSLTLTVLAELVAPAMMILGFKTRLAAIPAAFTMGVAAFVVRSDPLGDKELALLYLVCFAAVGAAGKWSLDAVLKRR